MRLGSIKEVVVCPHSPLSIKSRTRWLTSGPTSRGGSRCEPARSALDRKRRVGTYNNLLDAPKPHDRQIPVSYLMVSSLRLTLSLLPDPLRDLPQSFNRKQR